MSITERIRYGATELKAAYNGNLFAALMISILLHGAAIALYLTTAKPAAAHIDNPRDTMPTTVILDGEEILKKLEDPTVIVDPVDTEIGTGAKASGGGSSTDALAPKAEVPTKLNVVDDSTPSATDSFPTVDQLPAANNGADATNANVANGPGGIGSGPGNGPGNGPGGGDDPNANGNGEPIDGTAVWDPDMTLPSVDMTELTARVKYPALALDNRIEGKVLVKVLVGVDGSVERAEITSTTNRLFEGAALDAVKGMRFEPGMVNDQPVRVWINVPITFELDR